MVKFIIINHKTIIYNNAVLIINVLHHESNYRMFIKLRQYFFINSIVPNIYYITLTSFLYLHLTLYNFLYINHKSLKFTNHLYGDILTIQGIFRYNEYTFSLDDWLDHMPDNYIQYNHNQ